MSDAKRITVRLSPALHRQLKFTSETLGISMNSLAETALEKELRIRAGELEEELEQLLSTLQTYTAEDLEADIEAFAESEVGEHDPIIARPATKRRK